LKISDNGIGISEEQIHSSDSLGIMIIKDRVSQWNGNIEIKGNPGKGTTINVDIPL
jgi:signal transduction histidine kinase